MVCQSLVDGVRWHTQAADRRLTTPMVWTVLCLVFSFQSDRIHRRRARMLLHGASRAAGSVCESSASVTEGLEYGGQPGRDGVAARLAEEENFGRTTCRLHLRDAMQNRTNRPLIKPCHFRRSRRCCSRRERGPDFPGGLPAKFMVPAGGWEEDCSDWTRPLLGKNKLLAAIGLQLPA